MAEQYSWIPFYKEMALALLKYKSDRLSLLAWIYDNIGEVKGVNGKSLVEYLKEADGSRLVDVDPFSVFAIFNRGRLTEDKRIEMLRHFKSHLSLKCEVPTDFSGVPVMDARRSFFFNWDNDEHHQIETLWSMYEKALKGESFEDEFNAVVTNNGIKYSITMALFWIDPDRYLALDSSNRDYLKAIGMEVSTMPDYKTYMSILDGVKTKMADGTIELKSYAEISSHAWGKTDNMDESFDGSNDQSRVWMVWETAVFNEKVCIGNSVSDKMTDYSGVTSHQELKDAYQKAKENTDVSIPHAYWQFMKEVKIGDIVVVFRNQKVGRRNHHFLLGWGRFSSDLINDLNSTNPLQRTVDWVQERMEKPVEDDQTRNSLFFHGTTKEQAAHIMNLLGINSDTQKTMKYIKYIDYLKSNRNLILTGAPGTGKTYLAKAIAAEMGAETEFVQFHPSYDYTDFVEGLRPTASGSFERRDGIFKEFCRRAIIRNRCDDIEIIYDRIVEDIKNNSWKSESDGKVLVERNGSIVVWDKTTDSVDKKHAFSKDIVTIVTKELVEKRTMDGFPFTKNNIKHIYSSEVDRYSLPVINELFKRIKSRPYVFIIDEINRGELSKIFGELFFSIDPGYRGKSGLVRTQYQNMIEEDDEFADGFYIPENVYILGTMNDIDRSVESMDFAMRRRFSWLEVRPEDRTEMLDALGDNKAEAIRRMNSLNAAITATEGLGAAFQVGPAYFLKLKDGDFDMLWEMNVGPLLAEYLRGFRGADKKLEGFRKAYDGNAQGANEETGTELAD